MQKSLERNTSKFSTPRNYFLKSGLQGSSNFHAKLKKGFISPENKKILKSFGYRKHSKSKAGLKGNSNILKHGKIRAASPKFSNYFASQAHSKKASTTKNQHSKKIVFFQKSKKSSDHDSSRIAIPEIKHSGKASPRVKSRVLDPIKGKHNALTIKEDKAEKKKKNLTNSKNVSRYNKNFLKEKNSESTKPSDEKSKVQIKWESYKWPDIQSQLLFGQCIGEGSFAKVYDAFDKVLKKAVAVKVIKKKMFKSSKKRRLVQMEIDILSSLDHPNIVKFYRMLEDHKRVKKIIFFSKKNFENF